MNNLLIVRFEKLHKLLIDIIAMPLTMRLNISKKILKYNNQPKSAKLFPDI